MTELLFLLFYVGILTLPGLVITRFCKSQLSLFLTAVAASYALFSLAFIFANHYSVSAGLFTVVATGWLIASIVYMAWLLMRIRNIWSHVDYSVFIPIFVISILSGIYQVIFGSFTEVPADLFAHLERFQSALTQLNQDSLGPALSWQALLQQKSGVFYYLLAITANISGAPTETVITLVDYSNRTLFLIAIFFFTRGIFKEHSHVTSVASLATLLVATHMGINVFSYVRYYTLAPTMINMVIYLAAITIFLRVIASQLNQSIIIPYFAILLLTFAAAAIHVQEALFIVVMVSTISVIGILKQVSRVGILETEANAKHAGLVAMLVIIAFFIVYTYSNLNLTRAPNIQWRLWEFTDGNGLLPAITTLNLKFQFSRVITLWGMFVYLLFFLHIRRYQNNLFIIAGMLVPAFTVLNPLFVDVFVRHYNSTTLWRLCFLIPIHFVAADLGMHYARNFRCKGFAKKMTGLLVLVPLIVLLLPFNNTWKGIHFSRFPTLSSTDPELSYEYSSDLLAFLNELREPHRILTDPMTGYMVSAMTRHTNLRKKFMRDFTYEHFSFENYHDYPLKKYNGYLLIINRRPQKSSDIGALARHWSHREWQNTSYYYPAQLLDHVEANPDIFENLWSVNGISVYRIK